MLGKILLTLFGGVIGAIPSAIAGLIIGMMVGGNFFTGFRLNGVQGYEATGQIGLLAGCLLGLAGGVYIVLRILGRKKGKFAEKCLCSK